MVPLLRPHLAAAFAVVAEAADHVFPAEYRRRAEGKRGWGGANPRTKLARVIRKAGVSPWPRVWHSLRAS